MIALADIIEDFYYFAAEDENSSLFEQAQMMWNAAKNKAETAGLTLIDTADEPFDFNVHSVKGTAYDESLPLNPSEHEVNEIKREIRMTLPITNGKRLFLSIALTALCVK